MNRILHPDATNEHGSEPYYCLKAREKMNGSHPRHSIWGHNDSGTCYCRGCDGTDEEDADFNRWWSGHSRHCAPCRGMGPLEREARR